MRLCGLMFPQQKYYTTAPPLQKGGFYMWIEERADGRFCFREMYNDARTGQRKKVSVTMDRNTRTTRKEAEELLRRKIEAANSRVYAADTITLRALADIYLTDMKPFWKGNTYNRNVYEVRALCDALGNDTLVSSLTARYVRQAFAGSGRNNTSLNEDLRRLKAFLRWAYKNDYVEDVSWLDKLERYPVPSARERNREKYLEGEELRRLIPELKVDLNRYMIRLLALSGLRIGEAISLSPADIDFEERVIHVTKTYDAANKTISDSPKTDASYRDVYMQTELLDLCEEADKYMRHMAKICGFKRKLFLCDFDGQILSYSRLNTYFKENCLRVIGRPLTLHSLRHTHASLLFEQGVSLDAVSDRLGHSNSKITREIYLHITAKKRERYNAEIENCRLITENSPPREGD